MTNKLNANEKAHLVAIAENRIDEIEKESKETYRELASNAELRDDIINTNDEVVKILKSAVNKLSSI